jgi:hypothetical protein
MKSTAIISEDGIYRYELTREWDEGRHALWIMLNPSTADASQDDPTIRRCISFSQRWGFGGLRVCNLFALRATDPKELLGCPDPVGPENDDYILKNAELASCVHLAWGTKGALKGRAEAVVQLLRATGRQYLLCLGTTKDGHPKHPLYIRSDVQPLPYNAGRKSRRAS